MESEPALQITLFGSVRAEYGGFVAERFPTRKVSLLLAMLALAAPTSISRDSLIAALWPDSPESAARMNLRQAISRLRRSFEEAGIPGSLILADRDSVALAGADVTSDVDRFRHNVSDKGAPAAERLVLLQSALSRYAEFLPGHFEDWAVKERDRTERLFVAASIEAANLFLQLERGQEAVRYAQAAVEADPLSEAAHTTLIRAFAAAEDPSQAERQTVELRDMLHREFGATPSPEAEDAIRKALAFQSGSRASIPILMETLGQAITSEEDRKQQAKAAAELLDLAYAAWYGPSESEFISRLQSVSKHVESALEWSLAHDPLSAARISGGMARYWLELGYLGKGVRFLERTLQALPSHYDLAVARVEVGLVILKVVGLSMCDPRAFDLLDDAERRLEKVGDQWGVAHVCRNRGLVYSSQFVASDADQNFDRALAIFRSLDNRAGTALTLLCKALVRTPESEKIARAEMMRESYEIFSEIGNEWGKGFSLSYIASDFENRSPEQLYWIREAVHERMAAQASLKGRREELWAHQVLAEIALLQGDRQRLLEHLLNMAKSAPEGRGAEAAGAVHAILSRIDVPREEDQEEAEALLRLVRADPQDQAAYRAALSFNDGQSLRAVTRLFSW